MAVPKSKVSKQRRNKRRSSVWKLETPNTTTCPKCGAFRLPHRMCKSCLTYNGHEMGKAQAEAAKSNRTAEKEEGETPLSFCIEIGYNKNSMSPGLRRRNICRKRATT